MQNKPDTPARFARIPEAAKYAGLSRSALYAHLAAGTFSAVKSGRLTLVNLESVDAWLRALPAYEPGRVVLAA
jgi:excisionase family DNA binding protein